MAKRKKSSKRKGQKKQQGDEHGVKTVDEQLDGLFDEGFGDVEPKEGYGDNPDGTYEVRVVAAVLNNSQSSDRFQCSWDNIIVSGDLAGTHIFKHDGLDTEEGQAYFKGTLARLGYDDPTSKKELIKTLESIVEGPTYAQIRLSTRKKKKDGEITSFQNKRFLKALDADDLDFDIEEDEMTAILGEDGAEPTEASGSTNWEKGDEVEVDYDGTMYKGKIKKIKDDEAIVKFEDDSTETVALDELQEPEAEDTDSKGGEKVSWEKGDEVSVQFDGKPYKGKIKKIEEDQATVKFEDDSTETVGLDELEEPEAEDSGSGEPPSCELQNTKLNPKQRKKAKKLAKNAELDPDDYDSIAITLCEVGDYHGVTGKFKNAAKLIEAIEEAAEEN